MTEFPDAESDNGLLRNPDLLNARRSRLLIVDLQQKLVPVIPDCPEILESVGFLLHAAGLTGVPAVISEQYPRGLGSTVASITALAGDVPRIEKVRFSAAEEFCRLIEAAPDMARDTLDSRDQIVVVGIETHVCVLQTALDLVGQGFRVYVVADAVAARHRTDHDWALKRMRDSSVTLCTAESVAFEWCEVAGTDTFRAISRLVRDRADRIRESAEKPVSE
ncbi:MAG: isochorismatase family protein [Planctomycetaceae bacterium]